jgi:hypothetical protein
MRTLSQEVNASGIRPAEGFPAWHSTILKFSSALIFAAALALAPAPAFAQHGGGGGGAGGGGGSHGGGGGGGGHASGGSGGSGGSHAGGTSAPSGGGSGSHASATSAGGSNNNSGGHWWNPFHSGSSGNGNSGNVGNVKSGSNQSSEHYAAGNNTWQDPPATAGHTSGHVNYHAPATGARPPGPQRNPTNGAIASTRGAVAGPPHVFPPRHPGRPYYPYYPYYFYPYYGFGWGGGLWWGGFGPCDPFWGCYGYGYGYSGGGYGYYGGSFGGNYSADLSYDSSNDASQEPNPSLYAAPSSDAGQSSGEAPSQQPYVILYLKDGSSYAVSDYWLFGGKLHYITSYGGENVIDQSQLDLQRTVNENAARGVDFTLRPEPAGNGETAPAAPAPDTNPPPPPQ